MLDIGSGIGTAPVRRFRRNERGRDFVVGDIHGMFGHLDALLAAVGFAPGRDRLFAVGDLVDRGPASRDALSWLSRPWFHACRGNHEQFAIDSASPEELDYWARYNGGGWWLELSPSEQMAFRAAFLALPLALEVETAGGLVGIVHADVPPLISWEGFVRLLAAGHPEVLAYALFSRSRVQGTGSPGTVPGGVCCVYCGHTPVREAFSVGNVRFIDTGAVYAREGYRDARLTLAEIQPSAGREYTIRCSEPPAEAEVTGTVSTAVAAAGSRPGG